MKISNIFPYLLEVIKWQHILMLVDGIALFIIGLKIAKKILWILAIIVAVAAIVLAFL